MLFSGIRLALPLLFIKLSTCRNNTQLTSKVQVIWDNTTQVVCITYMKKSSISGMFVSMYKKATLYSSFERLRIPLGLMHRPGHLKISRSHVPWNIDEPSSYRGILFLIEGALDLKYRLRKFVASSTRNASTMAASTRALFLTFFLIFWTNLWNKRTYYK